MAHRQPATSVFKETAPHSIDLTEDQFVKLYRWADATPAILQAYIFGSRVKGTSRTDSDLDVAISVQTAPGLTNKNSFDQHWLTWTKELREALNLEIDLLRLHATETPNTFAGVNEASQLIYHRDAAKHAARDARIDRDLEKRLGANHVASVFTLVKLDDAAQLYALREEATKGRDRELARAARRYFYRNLISSIELQEFADPPRLYIVSGTIFRVRRRAHYLNEKVPDSVLDEAISDFLSHAWAVQKYAVAWCRQYGFPLPAKWERCRLGRSKPVTRQGRPPALNIDKVRAMVFQLMDHHDEFSRDDPEWNAQARLEGAVREQLCTDVGESTLRAAIKLPLEEWRRRKAGKSAGKT